MRLYRYIIQHNPQVYNYNCCSTGVNKMSATCQIFHVRDACMCAFMLILFIMTYLSGPLDAQMKHDIMDSAFITFHVGIIEKDYDIVKAEVCMKGHVGYQLNILKVNFSIAAMFYSN